MYYKYNSENSIRIPTPFNRAITPVFMGDDDKITDCAFSVHMTEWAPGCQIDAHSHDTQTEAMYCISGMGIAMVDGMEYPFVPDSMIVAPPKVIHQITNTGTEFSCNYGKRTSRTSDGNCESCFEDFRKIKTRDC